MPEGWIPVADTSAWKPVAPPAPDYHAQAQQSTGSIPGDALAGVGAGAIHTILGAYKLVRMIPGVGDKLPPPSEFIDALGVSPDTIAGHVGNFAEQLGEFMIPASKAAKITEGAGLITRAAAQAAAAGATRAAQTGGDAGQTGTAMALGAAGPVVGDTIALGRKVLSDPGVSAAALKFIPKGQAAVDLYEKVGSALDKIRAAKMPPAPPRVIRDSPAWAGFPEASSQDRSAAVAAPDAALPSGRAVGSSARAAALPARVAAVAKTAGEDADLLDELSEALSGKKFQRLKLGEQQAVREIAAKGSTSPATQPASVPPAIAPQVPATPVAQPAQGSVAEQLRDELLRGGMPQENALPGGPPPAPAAAVTPEGKIALRDMMRDVPVRPSGQSAFRSSRTADSPLALNDQGVLYTTPNEAYSKNWGPHTVPLNIAPENTLDLTHIPADEGVTAERFKKLLERNGVDVSDSLMGRLEAAEEAGGEMLQHFGQFGKKQLVDALKSAGFDSAKINEYVADTGQRSTSTLLFDVSKARPVAPSMPQAIAKANYAGDQHPEVAGAVYEAAGRADKATKLAQALHQGGISHADAVTMDPAHWQAVSKALGINPPSKESIGEALFRLQRLEAGK